MAILHRSSIAVLRRWVYCNSRAVSQLRQGDSSCWCAAAALQRQQWQQYGSRQRLLCTSGSEGDADVALPSTFGEKAVAVGAPVVSERGVRARDAATVKHHKGVVVDFAGRASSPSSASTSASKQATGVEHPQLRLSRVVANGLSVSRREAERIIARGSVTVNRTVVQGPATLVASQDAIAVRGKRIKTRAAAPRLFMVHKLPRELVTTSDPLGRPTIFERLATMGLPRNLMAVGRLDLKTEGIILFSTDGALARYLEHPSSDIQRVYKVRVWGHKLTRSLERVLAQGVVVDGFQYRPIHAKVISHNPETSNWWMELTLTEGKNQEIRRLMRHFRLEVNRLIRVQYGPYRLGSLPAGDAKEVPVYRHLLRAAQAAV